MINLIYCILQLPEVMPYYFLFLVILYRIKQKKLLHCFVNDGNSSSKFSKMIEHVANYFFSSFSYRQEMIS